ADGEIHFTHDFPKDGQYALRFRGYGQQVGNERVKTVIRIDGQDAHKAEMRSGDPRQPNTIEFRHTLKAGEHKIAIALLNPFSDPETGERATCGRQRVVFQPETGGRLLDRTRLPTGAYKPLMTANPGPALRGREAARRIVGDLARKAFRRPASNEEVERF